MPLRNDIAKILVGFTLVFCCSVGVYSQKAKTGQTLFMVDCASALNPGQERFFANPGGKSWQEYSNAEEVPELNGDNGESTFAVKTSSGFNSVRWMFDGQDNSIVEESCFSKSGELRSLNYEMRTAWGWGYEEHKVFGISGKTVQNEKRFFDTTSNQTISRPPQADDVPDFLRPEIYSSFNSLPFIATFNKQRVNAPKK
jgi:hypothetical protein